MSTSASPFWRFLEAEALDGAKLGDEAVVAEAVVLVKVETGDGGYKDLMISRHKSGRTLRKSEVSGILATHLVEVLDT